MKFIKRYLTITVLLIAAVFVNLYGKSVLTVNSWSGNIEMRVTPTSEWVRLLSDMDVPESAQIRLNGKNDYLYLQFPDGSEIKLSGTTMIEVKDIVDQKSGKKNSGIKLIMGNVVAKVKQGQAQDFQVETEFAVAAVRGTAFGVNYNAGDNQGNVLVLEGKVAVSDPKGKFAPVMITPGNYVAFQNGAVTPPAAAPQELFDSFEEAYVPPAPLDDGKGNNKDKDKDKDNNKDKDKDKDKGQDTVVTPIGPQDSGIQPTETQNTQGGQPALPTKLEPSKSDECASEGLNWSVSSETIDGKVWNKVLLSPTFKLADGKFILSLYLPVYFQNLDDLGYLPKWYNYTDWDFSTSLVNPDAWAIVSDIFHDLLMKIRYLGVKTDNFMLKIGSIPDFKIGHGILVDGYANDLNFPAERKMGVQMNIDFGPIGLETMLGDIFLTKLMAARFFVRPLYGGGFLSTLGIGVSAFVDVQPVVTNDKYMAFGYSVDLDLPILNIGIFSTTLFADLGSLGYTDGVNPAYHFKGWGVSAGLQGFLLIFDYRLEFRSYNNGFIGHYIDHMYDGSEEYGRLGNFQKLISGTNPSYNGFLFYIGKSWDKVGGAYLSFEQMYPSLAAVTNANTPLNNYLHIELFVDKCLFKKAYGKVMYDRKNFTGAEFFSNFFGNGSVITTVVYYEIAEATYVGLMYKKFYEEVNGVIVQKDTFGLETQLGF